MDIEKKALELDLIARVIGAYHTTRLAGTDANVHILSKPHIQEAFDRLTEADNARHAAEMEAFRREVSEKAEDAISHLTSWLHIERVARATHVLSSLTIPQPDPLVEAWNDAFGHGAGLLMVGQLKATLAARGLELVKKEPSQ